MNTQRNRWLLVALGVIALLYFGDLGYRKLYEEPIAKYDRAKTQLNKKLQDAKLQLTEAKEVSRNLEMLEKRSLPADSKLAVERYRDWLLQLTQQAKLINTSVDAGTPSNVTRTLRGSKRPIPLYRQFSFSVRGRGDLGQVTRFLYNFYSAGHLQKIRSLTLNPVAYGQLIDMTASIEALSLPSTENNAELSSLPSNNLAFDNLQQYQLISRRNLFGRGGAHWAWRQIQLNSITSDVQGVGEAWFSVSSEAGTQIISVGQSLSVGSVELKLLKVDDRTAEVEIDGQRFRLTIGQTLADALAMRDAS